MAVDSVLWIWVLLMHRCTAKVVGNMGVELQMLLRWSDQGAVIIHVKVLLLCWGRLGEKPEDRISPSLSPS